MQEASADFRSQLDKVQESIEAINGMSSFSGKAAKEAKNYFGEMHITILGSFKGLFDDLEANLQQHMEAFRSEVDVSESAVIKSTYLQDVQEDINGVFEDLEKQDEIIHDTIKEVSDISSATPPSFSDVNDYKNKTIKKLKEVDEDLASFNNKGDETDVKAIMNQIDTAMTNAKSSEGKARFADFEGASQGSVLGKLQDYNQDKKEEVMEKAKDARDSVLQDQNKPSSRDVVNKAYQEFKDGDITYDQYTAILNSVKNTSGNISEEKIKENTTESFIEYLEDHGMLEDYLEEHETVAKYVVDNMPSMLTKYVQGNVPIFLEKLGYDKLKLAERLMESDKIAREVANKSDPKFTREIMETLKKSSHFYKYAEYLKGSGWILGGAGYIYGAYDDVKNNGKTVGQAVAHGGTSLAIAVGAGLAISPAGWALAAGIGLTVAFEFLYDRNVFGLQDGLDKVGDKLSEWGSNVADAVGEAVKNPVIAAINPFA
ncbi:putative DNA-binding ArsR family transcriptional regulator [Virgibacillus natechei]|uniref:DNA-binding ArsR family transcriptional regulator n=1 Tax=Virgibacillus natechei TaxID=1216297 RepID=A0ABS4IKD0_9BACI|nr:T7SS effector LXG polymorphic toxin [Virgibacillus natechei]MBP1971419.1 putative DNA-binding ArsR family transcriptional regulator [Virgibacillus natechei]